MWANDYEVAQSVAEFGVEGMEFSCLDDVALLCAVDAYYEAALFDQGDDFLAELSYVDRAAVLDYVA